MLPLLEAGITVMKEGKKGASKQRIEDSYRLLSFEWHLKSSSCVLVFEIFRKNNDIIYEYPIIPANSAEDFPSNAFVLKD